MRFKIVAVGRLKERFWTAACDEYLKRLGPYGKVEVVEVADRDPEKVGGVQAALQREGEDILKVLGPRDYGILLAISGTERSSESLAAQLNALGLEGESTIAFIIGGSWGVSPAVAERANETLSFGPMTLPHNLARVVLLEQIYRACRINRGEPYHK